MPNSLVGQRFKVADRVTRASSAVLQNRFPKKYGNVIQTFEKINAKGNTMYYYKVLWDDKRSSEHAQHSLQSVK